MAIKILSSFRRSLNFFLQHFTHHQARAAALAYYTLFTFVPLLTLLLIVAKEFFLNKEIALFLLKTFGLQEKVLSILLEYAFRAFESTKGIYIGSAVIAYFWSSFALLTRLEKDFNKLLQFEADRSLLQRLYIYPLMLLFFPFAALLINVFSLFLTTTLTQTILTSSFLKEADPYIILLLHLLSPLLIGLLLGIAYFSIPNGKVEWRSALYAGLVAGILYQFFQWGYFYFQLHVIQYNPTLGTFAIFPLFLLWVNLNWLIILLGAEILAFLHPHNNNPTATKEVLP